MDASQQASGYQSGQVAPDGLGGHSKLWSQRAHVHPPPVAGEGENL